MAARSRLLLRLDAAIAKTRNPVDVACLRAERAGFLARQGHVTQARKLIDQLQAQFIWRPNAAVSAWISLAEGLHDHYSHLGATARDRIQRAHALSGAANLAPLHALAAAWLAHMDYVRHDMNQMAQHVVQALSAAAPDHHSARSRACLVVAEAYHFAGRLDQALPWYARSRSHAAAEGDEAHLSAAMHNQAWLRANQARFTAMFGEQQADQTRHALMGAESSGHFDAGIGSMALGSLVPMLRAQLLSIDGRHDEALALFDEHFDAAMTDGLLRLKACFLADMAWCRWQVGAASAAREQADAAEAALLQPCDVDDRAIAGARLAQVRQAMGEDERAGVLREHAERDLQVHRSEQARLAALLDETLAPFDAAAVLRTAPC